MDEKSKVLELYKEAAAEVFEVFRKADTLEYDSAYRELFAELFGRRQAYARVLKEVYGVSSEVLQAILDEVNK